MAQEEDKYNLEARFDAAVRVIRSLPEDGPFQPSDDMMLMFYSYFKQATLGPCNIPRPNGFWDTRGKSKWDAWSSLGNMTKEEAMMNYVDDIQLILETIPISDEVSDLVEKLGTFYAEVERGRGREDEEENEVDRRPFTRPFASEADVLLKPYTKTLMEGYGDLWEDIQNTTETAKEISVNGMADSSKERESKMERQEESSGSEMEEEEQGDGDDEDDDEEEEEDKGGTGEGVATAGHNSGSAKRERRSPDPRLLRVDGRRWKSGTWGSISSVEPSLSSLTNGTHSSLNSEEEEELACSIEPCVKNNPYSHLNGHLGDHSDVIPEKSHRATDSDNEEFCDSMEHLAMEEVSGGGPSKVFSSGSRTASVRRKDLWGETKVMLNGEERATPLGDPRLGVGLGAVQSGSSLSRRGRGSQSPRVGCGSQLCIDVEAECYCVTQSRVSRANVNQQIALALLRLQEDMSHVLHRLHTLEVLTVSQSRSPSPRQEDTLPLVRKRPSWWPFNLSPITVILTTAWPLLAHWLVQLYLQRKRRKIS